MIICYLLLLPIASLETSFLFLIQLGLNIFKRNQKKPSYLSLLFLAIGFIIFNFYLLRNILGIYLPVIFIHTFIILVPSLAIFQFLTVIGITGQIASGKSTLTNYLRENFNAKILSFDEINREILERPAILNKINTEFGEEVFEVDAIKGKVLNKKKMAEIIFKDKTKKAKLENITHPQIFIRFAELLLDEKFKKLTKYVFVENAILLRFAFLRGMCNTIISVCTKNKEELVERIKHRDNSTEEVATNILKNQPDLKIFEDYSNYVIYNDGTEEEFKENINKVINKIIGNDKLDDNQKKNA